MKLVINSEIMICEGNNFGPNDDISFSQEEGCLGLSGIVLNNVPKAEEIQKNIVDGTIQKHYKGSYVAWFYDKKNELVYISNDLLSKQSVYFYQEDGLILVNTSLFDLCADLRANGRSPHVNLEAVKYFCNENVFCEDMTYERNTFFLTAYSYLIIDCLKKSLDVKRLPVPQMKSAGSISDNEALREMEKLFTEACELQWKKNTQYGKDQLITVSGGMDSRAVLLHMIKQNPDSQIMAYTYAQSGSGDEIIAKRLVEDLGIDSTFMPLDNCEFAYQRSEIIDANEGQMYYIGSTGAIMMAKATKGKAAGIVHTGLGGGEIMGDICSMNGDTIQEQYFGLTINQRKNLDDIRRCLNFQKTTANYFHAFSPFLYEDFFEYVMCLPISMRFHRKLYIKWYKYYMNSMFPSATSHSTILKAIKKVKVKLYKAIGKRNPLDMNPIQYWYDTQPKLREYLEKTWKHDCEMLSEQIDLLQILAKYFIGTAVQKFAVLTVTGSVLRMMGNEL